MSTLPAFIAPAAPLLGTRKQSSRSRSSNCRKPRWKVAPLARAKGPVELFQDAQRVYSADKPVWCQPWTIVGTGLLAVGASWSTLRGWAIVLALLITGAVAIWWVLFLVIYPQQVLKE